MNKSFILIMALFINIAITPCQAQTELHITTGFTPPVSDFFQKVLAEANKRMPNISISFEILPAERSLILANQGINDGECCRIPAAISEEYKNLTAVKSSFFSARFNAFSKNSPATIKNFSDLKPFSVGTVEGWKIAVQKINEINPKETHIVTTPKQMFRMLDQQRIDYGVVGYLSGLKAISELNLNNIVAIEPPLIQKSLHLFLHKKHKKLLPEFNRTFKEMQEDGTINNLYNELLKSLK